jgi:hypothetical protein
MENRQGQREGHPARARELTPVDIRCIARRIAWLK